MISGFSCRSIQEAAEHAQSKHARVELLHKFQVGLRSVASTKFRLRGDFLALFGKAML